MRRAIVTGTLLLALAALVWLVVSLTMPDRPDAPPDADPRRVATSAPDDEPEENDDDDEEIPPWLAELAGRLTGTVTGDIEDVRQPIPGARVRVFRRTDRVGSYELDPDALSDPVAETVTDEEGAFALDLPDEDRVWLVHASSAHGVACRPWRTGKGPITLLLESISSRTFRVVDVDGAPVVGAEVVVYGPDPDDRPRPAIGHAGTDGGGEVTVWLSVVDWLLVRAPGYAASTVGEALDASEIIVLRRPTRVDGTVVDEDGRPLADATVALDRGAYTDSVLTGPDGRFVFEDLSTEDGLIYLTVSGDGRGEIDEEVRPGARDLRIVLPLLAGISGRVLGPDGTVEPSARVRYRARDDSWCRWRDVDDQGRFRIPAVRPGLLVVEARRFRTVPGVGPVTTRLARAVLDIRRGGKTIDLELRLGDQDVSFLLLRVQDPDGRPLVGARVATRAVLAVDDRPRADVHGIIRLPCAVPPGESVHVAVEGGGDQDRERYRYVTVELPTSAGPDRDPHVVVLPRNPALTILVRTPDGKPLRASVRATVRLNGREVRRSGPDRFVTPPTAWVRCPVVVEAGGHGAVGFDLTDEHLKTGRVEVQLPEESVLTGRVERLSGTPPPTVGVSVEGAYWGKYLTPDDRGRFTFRGVPAGRVQVSVEDSRGNETVVRILDLAAGQTVDLGDLATEAERLLLGRILRPDGTGAGGAVVSLVDDDGDEIVETSAAADGAFSMRVPRMEGGRIEVTLAGLAPGSRPLPADGTSLTIRLAEEGRVRIRFEPPLPFGATVGFLVDGRWHHEHDRIHAADRDDGPRYLLRELSAGETTIRAYSHDGAGRQVIGEVEVTVAAGATREAVLRLRRADR